MEAVHRTARLVAEQHFDMTGHLCLEGRRDLPRRPRRLDKVVEKWLTNACSSASIQVSEDHSCFSASVAHLVPRDQEPKTGEEEAMINESKTQESRLTPSELNRLTERLHEQ